MKRFRSLMLVLLIVVLSLFAVAGVVSAQEVTPEPGDVVVLQPDESVLTSGQLLLYVGLAVLGGGGAFAMFTRFTERKEARDLGEKLYESASPKQQEIFHDIVNGYKAFSERILAYLDAVSDGKPNSDGKSNDSDDAQEQAILHNVYSRIVTSIPIPDTWAVRYYTEGQPGEYIGFYMEGGRTVAFLAPDGKVTEMSSLKLDPT